MRTLWPPPSDTEAIASSARASARQAARGLLVFSTPHFLASLVALFVTSPLIAHADWGELIEAILITVVLLSAVPAVGGRRTTWVPALLLAALAVATTWGQYFRPDLLPNYLPLLTAALLILFVVVQLQRYILRAPRVNGDVLCAGIANYMLLGFLWAFAYLVMAEWRPGSFEVNGARAGAPMRGPEALFFSFATLTTSGVTNVHPTSSTTQMMATAESLVGVLYTVVLIARLVALYTRDKQTTA